MGHAKTIDEADLQEVLSLQNDFRVLQKDNTVMRTDVSRLQEDVQSISSKQGEISLQVGGIEKAMLDLGKQLSTMSSVLQNIVAPSDSRTQREMQPAPSQIVRSPTLQQE